MKMAEYNIESVFNDVKLEIYLPTIIEEGFDDLDHLISLSNEDLNIFFAAVEISKIGHQQRIKAKLISLGSHSVEQKTSEPISTSNVQRKNFYLKFFDRQPTPLRGEEDTSPALKRKF